MGVVSVLAAPLLIQLSADSPRNSVEAGLKLGPLYTHADLVSGFSLLLHWLL